jgi:SAM-dependent methyltransferase
MIFFTICSKNFLAQALTLYDSLVSTYGPIMFYVALCDTMKGLESLSLPFEVIEVDQLGMPEWKSMRKQYNITELNTALKPFVFLYLFERHLSESVVYLDPDILVMSRLLEVEEAFAAGAPCVLTPHITEPAEFAEFDDQKFLVYGIYNLGFCALRDTPAVRRVVSWWARRLEHHCLIDLEKGLFVDQKWADLLPVYLEHTSILRHSGYNVAYWNLSQRRVSRIGDTWKVNGVHLRFAHFSGCTIGSPTVFSRHCSTFTRQNIGDLAALLEEYESRLYRHGYAFFRCLPYGFNWNGAGKENRHTPSSSAVSPTNSGQDANDIAPHWLPVTRCSSFADSASLQQHQLALTLRRRKLEASWVPNVQGPFYVNGHCALCEKPTRFSVKSWAPGTCDANGIPLPDLREDLHCTTCGMVNRERAALHIFLQEIHPSSDSTIYVTGLSSQNYAWLARRFPRAISSDGTTGTGTTQHPFLDGSFDYILSLDVLNHLPDYQYALREMHRCLRPRGKLLFTVPFASKQEGTTTKSASDGEWRSRRFGWELFRDLKDTGFITPFAMTYWSKALGYLGEDQWVCMAEKQDLFQDDTVGKASS